MEDLHFNVDPSAGKGAVVVDSPVGKFVILASLAGITGVCFEPIRIDNSHGDHSAAKNHLDAAVLQFDEYFAGKRIKFQLALDIHGTKFQQAVWEATQGVAFAETVTYGDIARAIGSIGAARAVGSALSANPLPIIVPCHRVVGAGGRLAGFSCGLSLKRELLEYEARQVATRQHSPYSGQ